MCWAPWVQLCCSSVLWAPCSSLGCTQRMVSVGRWSWRIISAVRMQESRAAQPAALCFITVLFASLVGLIPVARSAAVSPRVSEAWHTSLNPYPTIACSSPLLSVTFSHSTHSLIPLFLILYSWLCLLLFFAVYDHPVPLQHMCFQFCKDNLLVPKVWNQDLMVFPKSHSSKSLTIYLQHRSKSFLLLLNISLGV